MKKYFLKFTAVFMTIAILLGISITASADTAISVCSVKYYSNAEKTAEIDDITKSDPKNFVWYEILCEEGYVCHTLSIDAEYADSDKIFFGSLKPTEILPKFGLLGDVDGDGGVKLADVSMIMRYIAGYVFGGSYNGGVSDYNGDGKVNLTDCADILKKIAGWNGVTIGDSVPDNMRIYCTAAHADEIIFQGGVCEMPNGASYITVARDTEGLNEYIGKVSDLYLMNDADTVYSADDLRDKYSENFFADNDLIIMDLDAPLYIGKIPENITVEQATDGGINIVITDAFGLVGTKDCTAHCLIAVPKSLNVSPANTKIINRYTISQTFDTLHEYEEKEYFTKPGSH